MAVYNRGWYDTREHIQRILAADEFLTKLVFKHVDIQVLNDTDPPTTIAALTIFCNARYPAHGKPLRTREYIDSLVVGEMMAPVIPQTNVLDRAAARAEFATVMEYLIDHTTIHNRNKGYTEWIAMLGQANEALEAQHQQPILDREDLDIINFAEYLVWLAVSLPNSMHMSPVLLVVASYVGVAKRGTMSDTFINKIQTGIHDELGVEINLDADMIKFTYINFGKYITATNAAQVFERWLADIPELALWLRLSLEQVSGSGLTAYIVIGRCMQKYNDFPWDRLNVVTEGEVDKYIVATRLVAGNAYFGFNRDLGAARSTLYSSVAYTAKELLIRIAGETSLSKYQGWIKRPKNPAAVQRLIDNYVNIAQTRLEGAADNELEPRIRNEYMQAINNDAHNNMFA